MGDKRKHNKFNQAICIKFNGPIKIYRFDEILQPILIAIRLKASIELDSQCFSLCEPTMNSILSCSMFIVFIHDRDTPSQDSSALDLFFEK